MYKANFPYFVEFHVDCIMCVRGGLKKRGSFWYVLLDGALYSGYPKLKGLRYYLRLHNVGHVERNVMSEMEFLNSFYSLLDAHYSAARIATTPGCTFYVNAAPKKK